MRPVLITAGATRNPVDAIRFLSAHATGQTGVELARALGDGVLLLGSAEACLRGVGLATEEFSSTRDLEARMHRWVDAHPDGVVVHSAAVGDYEAVLHPGKIPSGQERVTIELVPAPKILDQIRTWSPRCSIVSFKAAAPDTTDESLVAIADAQRKRTGCALVFANVLGRTGARIALVDGAGARWYATRGEAKDALLARVRELRLSAG